MRDWKRLGRTLVLLGVFGLMVFICRRHYQCLAAEENIFDQWALANSMVLLIWPLVYFIVIAIARYRFYRETPPVEDGELPLCTVIVPAYNEGSCVASVLQSICQCDYPANKMEIIAIDDGSADDTLQWIQRAAGQFSGRVRVIHCPRNQGKRHALYSGFRAGNGEFFITVDSDSIVAPDALRRMVSPMVRDASIGAVAGNVRVANTSRSIFPPMLDAGFTFAFDFIRSGQSVFKSVFCTPGALSAYRRTAIMPVLAGWRRQSFLGRPAGIGEDRAMTNLILKQGYGVVMQRSAYIKTKVPETYRGFAKMLLRWERSNIRENLYMFTFIFKNFHLNDIRRWFMLFSLLQYTVMTLLPALMIWGSVYNIIATRGELLSGIIAMALLWAGLPAAVNLQRNSNRLIWYCYFYGVFHVLTLFWLVPFAWLTVWNSNWMTRMKPNPSSGRT